MPANLYYIRRIRGFQQELVKYNGSSVRYSLKRTKFQCNHFGSFDVISESLGRCLVHGEPMGSCHEVIFEFTSYRLYCPRCKTRAKTIDIDEIHVRCGMNNF